MGQVGGLEIVAVAEFDEVEFVDGALASDWFGDVLVEEWGFDVFFDGELADEVEGLEDEAYSPSSLPTQGGVVE